MNKINVYDEEITGIYDDLVTSGYYDYPNVVKTLTKILENRKTVLELGIGTGNIAIPLTEAGFKVDGIDPSPHMLKVLGNKLKKNTQLQIKTYIQGAEELSVKDKYDLLFSFGSPFWVVVIGNKNYFDSYLDDKEEYEKTLEKAHKTLNKNGLLLLNMQHHGESYKMRLKNGVDYHFVIEVKDKNHILKTHYFEKDGNPLFNKAYPMFRLSESEALEMFKSKGFENEGPDETKTFWVLKIV